MSGCTCLYPSRLKKQESRWSDHAFVKIPAKDVGMRMIQGLHQCPISSRLFIPGPIQTRPSAVLDLMNLLQSGAKVCWLVQEQFLVRGPVWFDLVHGQRFLHPHALFFLVQARFWQHQLEGKRVLLSCWFGCLVRMKVQTLE